MANQRNPDGTIKITGVRGSSSSKKTSSSNKTSSNKTSSSSSNRTSSSSGKRAPGTVYSSGGKDYIVSGSGLSVQLDSSAGQRLQNQYGSSGSSKGSSGGSGLRVNVAGAQTTSGNRVGNSGVFSNAYNISPPKIEVYQNDSGLTAADADYNTKKVARLKNGLQVTQKYIDENPGKDYYTMDSSPNIRNSVTIGNVPRYGSGSSSYGMIFNGKPVGIRSADGTVYYPDNVVVPEDAWASMQARMDYQYGNRGEDITRQNMPQAYYDVLADLNAGRGYNGSGLRMGTPEWESIWGSGEFNQDAYNQLVEQGAVAPYRDYWGDYGNLSPETGGFARGYNAAPLYSTGDESDMDVVTGPAGGYGNGFSINNNIKGIPNTGLGYDYMDEYRAALEASQEAMARAYEEQINAGLAVLNAQRDPLQQQYNDSAQQAYINAELARKNLPQQLAAQGISGGASESSNLAISTQYGNALNDLTTNYNQSLADLERDIAQYRATGNSQLAQNAANYQQQLADVYLSALQQQQQYNQSLALMEYENQLNRQNALDDMALQLAYEQAKKGISGGSSGGSYSGRSTDWDMLANAYEMAYDNGEIGWEELNRAMSQLAQGIIPSSGGVSNSSAISGPYSEAYAQAAEIRRLVANGSMTAREGARRLTALEAQYGINID